MYSCLKIVVREWSPLADPDVFKRVWAGQLASPDHSTAHHSGIAAEVRTKLLEHKTIPSARALAGELRLEHNHFRMVGCSTKTGRHLSSFYWATWYLHCSS